MSLRNTLDRIRDIEGRIDFPPEERQRIKIELVKRFYVDSAPLVFDTKVIDKFKDILQLKPIGVICVNKAGKQKKRIKYSFELNSKLDQYLLEIQLELQKKKFFMPPRDDMATIGARMS
jgi:hypothetical protein